ncbi:sensor histidine kinase [Chloroflexota bacterium]
MYTNPQLALLVDHAYEPLILLDDTRRVVAANQTARTLLPESAIVGAQLDQMIDNPDLTELLDCVLIHSNCPEAQFRVGQSIYRARCNRFTMADQAYIALAMQDITELLRLNRARRDMVANISHELRTPISAIRLLRDTLQRQAVGKKQREKMLRKIGRELDTLQRIVDGMHDLSMIESGQSIMKLIEIPLYLLVDDALDHMDEQIDQKSVKIKKDVGENLYVLVDPDQMGRVLANLIHNAIKAISKKGTVRVSARLDVSQEAVVVCIEDNGPGIPPDERNRIFERFYQLDESRTSRRGTGLGLSISRHIIEAHQGRVWVDASDLGGAKFCFTLLAAPQPKTDPQPELDQPTG